MPESKKHEELKRKEAGKEGKKEAPLKRGGRLDVATPRKAVEIQMETSQKGLQEAAKRLKRSRKPQKVLVVLKPKDVPKAAAAMRKEGVGGTARTPDGSRRISVKKPKSK